jgi:hypothetical protein
LAETLEDGSEHALATVRYVCGIKYLWIWPPGFLLKSLQQSLGRDI